MIAPISVPMEAMVMRSSSVSFSISSPYNSTEYPSKLFAPKRFKRLRTISFAKRFSGRFPLILIFTDCGTLNQTFPLLKATAMSWSPIPCPNAPIAPRMLACESVVTDVEPGIAIPSSIKVCVPIPLSMSKTRIPRSRANTRQTC